MIIMLFSGVQAQGQGPGGMFAFKDDSLFQHYPKWQQLPGQQKKPSSVIEI